MIICFSGTPGSGKTTLAEKSFDFLKNSSLDGYESIEYYDNERVIKEFPEIYLEYDKNRDTKVIDESLLTNFFKEIKSDSKIILFDSHLSHYLSSEIVDLFFITRTDIETLRKRLENRGYSKEKINENIQSEIFKICYIDALEFNHSNIITIDTNKKIEESFKTIKKELNNLIFN
ncbi:MAG: AAA family ATPase [Candidatus Woesearchaeota archaeon]